MGEVSLAESSPERNQVASAKELFTEKPIIPKLNSRHRRVPSQPETRAVPLYFHNRSTPHRRKPSICILPGKTYDQVISELDQPKNRPAIMRVSNASNKKNVSFCSEVEETSRKSKASSHVRTASDLDSVIYLGPEESIADQSHIENISELSLQDSLEITSFPIPSSSYEKATTVCETGTWARRSKEKAVRLSLPVFGPTPVAAYCPHCKLQVHTSINFIEDPGITGSVMTAFSSVFGCCGVPTWLNSRRMHYCTNCRSVLAKTG
jgi:hypothetical protein